jgi:uncharacterized membrane protein HdeD (DUF308 family)
MAHLYGRSWWSLFLRGVLAVLFGILAIALPESMLRVLVTIFGVIVLVVGLVAVVGAIMNRRTSTRWPIMLIPGLAGVVIGIISIVWPAVTIVVLAYLIAIWALVHGIGEIYNAIKLREDVRGEWMPMVTGVISTVFGIVLLVRPLAAGAVLTWLIGLFVLIMGVLWVVLSLRARKWEGLAE